MVEKSCNWAGKKLCGGGRENIIHTPELSSDYLEGEGGEARGKRAEGKRMRERSGNED